MFEELYKPHEDDIHLLNTLRVDTSKYVDKPLPREDFHLGTVETEAYRIDLYVFSCPACFYRAKVFSKQEGKSFEFSTGSGKLKDYWPIFEKFGEGMVEVEVTAHD